MYGKSCCKICIEKITNSLPWSASDAQQDARLRKYMSSSNCEWLCGIQKFLRNSRFCTIGVWEDLRCCWCWFLIEFVVNCTLDCMQFICCYHNWAQIAIAFFIACRILILKASGIGKKLHTFSIYKTDTHYYYL